MSTSKKTVYYMRHFEALHNIQPYNFNLPDPELSPLGKIQAQTTIETIESIPKIDLIVCSPLTRTLQSYLLVFSDQLNIPLIIHPDLQEQCTELCDIGSPLDNLKKTFPNLAKQLTIFGETFGENEWLDKHNPESIYSPEKVTERTQRFLQWIKSRPEENIFVISHNLLLGHILHNPNEKEIVDLKNGEIRMVEYSNE